MTTAFVFLNNRRYQHWVGWRRVTPQAQAMAGTAIQEYTDTMVGIHLGPIPNLYDAQDCFDLVHNNCNSCERQVRISPKEILSNITGGTKPLSMGRTVGCIEGGVPIEHVPTQYDSTHKPIMPLPPIELVMHTGD